MDITLITPARIVSDRHVASGNYYGLSPVNYVPAEARYTYARLSVRAFPDAGGKLATISPSPNVTQQGHIGQYTQTSTTHSVTGLVLLDATRSFYVNNLSDTELRTWVDILGWAH